MNAESTKCSDSSYNFEASSFNNDFNTNKSFTTQNGMEWWIVPQVNTKGGGNAEYQTDIYVDVDSSDKSPNCIYDSESCKNPDRFKFLLAADGTVIPADPMGLMYIETRKSFLKNKNQKVSDTTIESNLTDKLKKFEYQPCIESHFIEAANDCVNGGGVWDNYTNTCSCANTEEYWDDSAKTCRNPRLECEAAGNTWVDGVCKTPQQICTDAGNTWVDGVCKTPQQICTDSGNVWEDGTCKEKSNPKIQVEWVPIRIKVISKTGSQVAQVPVGLFLKAKIPFGKTYTSDASIGFDFQSNGHKTTYSCKIPAGHTMCVTKVVNSCYLQASPYYYLQPATIGEPYRVPSGTGFKFDIELISADARTADGFWDYEGWDFEVQEIEIGTDARISQLLDYSGLYALDPSLMEYHTPRGSGTDWYFNDLRCNGYSVILKHDPSCFTYGTYGVNYL